jgi:hypothetical protein
MLADLPGKPVALGPPGNAVQHKSLGMILE